MDADKRSDNLARSARLTATIDDAPVGHLTVVPSEVVVVESDHDRAVEAAAFQELVVG